MAIEGTSPYLHQHMYHLSYNSSNVTLCPEDGWQRHSITIQRIPVQNEDNKISILFLELYWIYQANFQTECNYDQQIYVLLDYTKPF